MRWPAQALRPLPGRKQAFTWALPDKERDYLLQGAQWRRLQEALRWLSASPVERIFLYNGPIDTAWLHATDGPVALAMEARFSGMLAEEAGRHPKVTLLDFYRKPLPCLANRHFHDQTHLNREGSVIFSRYLGSYLAGVAHPRAGNTP